MSLEPDELNPTDRLALDLLREGRCTAAYIADVGDYSTGNVRSRLKRLLEHDHVERIHDGLYELVDDPDPPADESIATSDSSEPSETAASEPRDSVDAEPSGDHGEQASTASDRHDAADADRLQDRARAALETLEVKGRGDDVVATRKEAVLYAWDLVRSRGETTSSELTDEVWNEFADRRTGYSASTSETRADGYNMWDNCVRDLLKDLPGIEAPPERGSEWRWVDDEDTDTAADGVYDPTAEFE